MANAACATIDKLRHGLIVGTIAGDDTILIITRSTEASEELCEYCSPVFRFQSDNRYGGGYSVNRRSGGFGESVSGHTEISFSNRPPESPKPQTGNKKYTVGQRVEHTVFGNGVICSVTPMGGDLLLGITFEKSGNKKIMASYAKLKIL